MTSAELRASAQRDSGKPDDIRYLYADALDQLAALQAEIKDEQYVREKVANLLRRTAIVLKGPEPEMIRWDWSSIPEQVQALVAKLAAAEQEIQFKDKLIWTMRESQLHADAVAAEKRASQAEACLAAVREKCNEFADSDICVKGHEIARTVLALIDGPEGEQ